MPKVNNVLLVSRYDVVSGDLYLLVLATSKQMAEYFIQEDMDSLWIAENRNLIFSGNKVHVFVDGREVGKYTTTEMPCDKRHLIGEF